MGNSLVFAEPSVSIREMLRYVPQATDPVDTPSVIIVTALIDTLSVIIMIIVTTIVIIIIVITIAITIRTTHPPPTAGIQIGFKITHSKAVLS